MDNIIVNPFDIIALPTTTTTRLTPPPPSSIGILMILAICIPSPPHL